MSKNVLADNPLELVMGAGYPRRAPETDRHSQAATPAGEGRAAPSMPLSEPVADGTSRVAESASEWDATVHAESKAANAPQEARPKRSSPASRSRTDPDREENASLKHRIGTMKAPYERTDGMLVRQWSVTLPVDVISRMHHLAIDRRLKPAELALQAIQEFLAANTRGR
jgi:hypothetical protein